MEPFDLRHWSGFGKAGGDLSQPAVVYQIEIDTRRITENEALFVALPGQTTDGHKFIGQTKARWRLVKRGVEQEGCLQVDDPLTSLQEIVATYRSLFELPVIAIVGSHGKTLVKDLLASLLSLKWNVSASPESFNSQIGVPLSVLQITKDAEIACIEAAVSLPGEMERLRRMIQPTHVVVTPVTTRHLATLGSQEVIWEENLAMCHEQKESGWTLLPSKPLGECRLPKGRTFFWSQPNKHLPFAAWVKEGKSKSLTYTITFENKDVYLGKIEQHFSFFLNIINIAMQAAFLLGVPLHLIVERLKNYRLELMQREVFRSLRGQTLINEPYGSDPQSLQRALSFLSTLSKENERSVFFFGGLKQASVTDHQRAKTMIGAYRPDLLYTYGAALPFGENHYQTLKEAFLAYRKEMKSGDMVLIKGEKKVLFEELSTYVFDSALPTVCTIDVERVRHNVSLLQKRLPKGGALMAMVKASGYGTDSFQLAKYLAEWNVSYLGLSFVDEAILLKQAGVSQRLFVLHATPDEAGKVASFALEVGVSDERLIEALAGQNKPLKVHLHVDTGMHRFGCTPKEALFLAKKIEATGTLTLEGVFTHLVGADDPKLDAFSQEQLRSFENVVEELHQSNIHPRWIHAQNSQGLLRFSPPFCTMARVGLGLFGLTGHDLECAITLQSKIVGLSRCQKGDTVSYGRGYEVTRQNACVAQVPLGYHDGLGRKYSGKGCVWIRGKKAFLVGSICMDYAMVDVSHLPDVQVGDPVLFFGRDEHGHFVAPEEFAKQGGTIAHELIACLGPRIPRVFVHA